MKKLRRARKGGGGGNAAEINRRSIAPTSPRTGISISVSSILTTVGVLVAAGVLILFAASAWIQFREGFAQKKAAPAAAAATNVPGAQTAALPAVDPGTIEVRVLNGCGEPGASRDMTTRLRDLRFDVVSAGNANNFDYENTLVVNHTDRPEIGASVSQALGCARLSSQGDEMAMCDVTVILGKDWNSYMGRPEPEQPTPSPLRQIFSRARSILGLN